MQRKSMSGPKPSLIIVRICQKTHMELVKAMDLVDFMDTPEMQLHSGLKKQLDILTVQCWMQKLDYCWTYLELKGQYIDGHERDDIVKY